jgi:HK97 family phage portal protein
MFQTLLSSLNINVPTLVGTDVQFAEFQAARIRAMIEGNGMFTDTNVDAINTIYTCKKILCDTVSKLPLNITSANKKFKDHKLWNLIHNQPNSYQTTNVWVSTMLNHCLGWGNAWSRIKKPSGDAVSIDIIHPSKLTGYRLNEAGVLIFKFGDEEIRSTDLIHLMMYSDNGLVGQSPTTALMRQLSINYQANSTIDNYYRNGLHSNKAIKSVVGVTGKEYNESLIDWQKQNSGTIKAGEMVSIPFGTEIQELKLAFADAELLPTLKYNTTAIGALYGIPLFMLGVEEMRYKSIEDAIIAFQTQTIAPLANMFKKELSAKLLSPEDLANEVAIEFSLQAMMAADGIARSTYLKTMVDAAIISPDQAAAIEGFDAYDGGQYHYKQSQYQPLELTAKNGEWKPVTTANPNANPNDGSGNNSGNTSNNN